MSNFRPMETQITDIASAGFEASEQLLVRTLSQIHATGSENGTNYIYAAILHAAAGVQYLARAMANGETAHEKSYNGGKETMLVAALAVARSVIPNGEGVSCNFSPRNIMAALEAAKKIVPDVNFEKHLCPNMLKAFRVGCEEQGLTLGYWDYLQDVGPSFDGFEGSITSYSKH